MPFGPDVWCGGDIVDNRTEGECKATADSKSSKMNDDSNKNSPRYFGSYIMGATICVIGMFVAACIGLYRGEALRVETRNSALAKLKQNGGIFIYDYMNVDRTIEPPRPTSGPWIKRKLFGEVSVQAVERIQFQFRQDIEPNLSEQEIISILRPFRNELKTIGLSGTRAGDLVVKELVSYPELEYVGFSTGVTDDAAREFAMQRPDVHID